MSHDDQRQFGHIGQSILAGKFPKHKSITVYENFTHIAILLMPCTNSTAERIIDITLPRGIHKSMGLSLDNLEQRLQSLIEVHLVNLLPGRKAEDVIAKQLATAVKSNISEGQPVPNRYIIFVNPKAIDQWNKDPRLLEGLSQILRLIASEANFKFEAIISTN